MPKRNLTVEPTHDIDERNLQAGEHTIIKLWSDGVQNWKSITLTGPGEDVDPGDYKEIDD